MPKLTVIGGVCKLLLGRRRRRRRGTGARAEPGGAPRTSRARPRLQSYLDLNRIGSLRSQRRGEGRAKPRAVLTPPRPPPAERSTAAPTNTLLQTPSRNPRSSFSYYASWGSRSRPPNRRSPSSDDATPTKRSSAALTRRSSRSFSFDGPENLVCPAGYWLRCILKSCWLHRWSSWSCVGVGSELAHWANRIRGCVCCFCDRSLTVCGDGHPRCSRCLCCFWIFPSCRGVTSCARHWTLISWVSGRGFRQGSEWGAYGGVGSARGGGRRGGGGGPRDCRARAARTGSSNNRIGSLGMRGSRPRIRADAVPRRSLALPNTAPSCIFPGEKDYEIEYNQLE